MTSSNRLGGTSVEGLSLAVLIGLAPVLVVILSWDPDGVSSAFGRAVREYALPVLAVEGITVGVAAVSGLFQQVRRAPIHVLSAAVGWLLLAFFTAAFVAPDTRLSMFLTAIWVLHALFAASVAHLCRTGVLKPALVGRMLMTGFLLYALLLILFLLQLDVEIELGTDVPGLGNIRRVGAYATGIAAVAIGAMVWRRGHAFALIVATAALFFGFWSGSRATSLAVAAGLVASLALSPAARDSRLLIGAPLSAALGFLAALLFPVDADHFGALRSVLETSDSGRYYIWRSSIDAILQSPWLGYGEGQTVHILPDNPNATVDHHAHPHNILLQLLMAWGAVGTFLIGILASWLAPLLWKTGRSTQGLPFILSIGAMAIHAIFDGALYDVAPVFLFASLLGAALGVAACKTEDNEHCDGT